jgi:hypothetical protein
MKKVVAVFCVGASLTGGLAQGLISFVNTASTLVSAGPPCSVAPCWSPGSYYFALLTSPVGANNFTFAGVYGTNLAALGRFRGGVGVAVNGWAAGTARDFEVVGWSSSEGLTFNPAWLTGSFTVPGLFGISSIGTGVAGGNTDSGPVITLNIFGGVTGIQSGFDLLPVAPPLRPFPQLHIVKAGPNLVLSWPTNASGFNFLGSSTDLGSAAWTYAFPPTVVVNGQNFVTNPISGTQLFFQLSQ